jgi:hypothetical protein
MNRVPSRLCIRKIDIVELARATVILLAILMTIIFFAGCQTKKEQADSNSVLREGPSDHEIHGEVGAMYDQGASRH